MFKVKSSEYAWLKAILTFIDKISEKSADKFIFTCEDAKDGKHIVFLSNYSTALHKKNDSCRDLKYIFILQGDVISLPSIAPFAIMCDYNIEKTVLKDFTSKLKYDKQVTISCNKELTQMNFILDSEIKIRFTCVNTCRIYRPVQDDNNRYNIGKIRIDQLKQCLKKKTKLNESYIIIHVSPVLGGIKLLFDSVDDSNPLVIPANRPMEHSTKIKSSHAHYTYQLFNSLQHESRDKSNMTMNTALEIRGNIKHFMFYTGTSVIIIANQD